MFQLSLGCHPLDGVTRGGLYKNTGQAIWKGGEGGGDDFRRSSIFVVKRGDTISHRTGWHQL